MTNQEHIQDIIQRYLLDEEPAKLLEQQAEQLAEQDKVIADLRAKNAAQIDDLERLADQNMPALDAANLQSKLTPTEPPGHVADIQVNARPCRIEIQAEKDGER